MNQQLESALKSAQDTTDAVRAAHSEAVASGNEFAQVVLLGLIAETAKVTSEVRNALHAANMAAQGGKL